MTYKRRVTPAELAGVASGGRPSQPLQKLICCVIEGEGHFEEAELRLAIEKMAEAWPASRLVLRGALLRRHWSAVGALPVLTVVEGEWDGRSSLHGEFANAPLDLFNGPSMDIILHKSDTNRLMFRFHHAITDGIGALQYTQNFFRVLRGEEPISSYSQLVDEDITDQLNCEEHAEPISNALIPSGKPTAGAPVNRGLWYRISVQKTDLFLFPKAIVALAQSARQHGDGTVRFFIPINLRRHLDEDEPAMANLVAPMILDVEEEDTYRSISKKFNLLLAAHRDAETYRLSKMMKIAHWMPLTWLDKMRNNVTDARVKSNNFPLSGIISTLGKTELKDFSTNSFTASATFALPVIILDVPLFIAIWSNDNCHEITLGAPSSVTSDSRLKKLAEELKLVLESS